MHSFLLSILLVSALGPPSIAQTIPPSPYAPVYVPCVDNLQIRPASEGLSPEESAWLKKRLPNVVDSLKSYLPRANIKGFDLDSYLSRINAGNVPILGLAISGGGTQSGLGGLGVWQAFDERYPPAVKAGTGGLTQCLSYLTGLSGGGFITVATLASNNFSSVQTVKENIDFGIDYTVGPTGNQTEYFDFLFENTAAKIEQGFPVSVTDIFGQWWRQYLPEAWAYRDYSDIALTLNHSFALGTGPMPILSLAEVVPGSSPSIDNIMYPGVNDSKATNFELTPFEFGSWLGGRVQAFMPTQWLGSTMDMGKPENASICVNGFDKMTFAQGSTANAFNFYLIDEFFNIPLFAKREEMTASSIAERASSPNTTIVIPPGQENNPNYILPDSVAENFNISFNQSLWATYPNPFMNYNEEMNGITELLVVDGSETGETIPLRPLIIPERKVDFIIAFDSGGDQTYNWVSGTVLLDTSVTAKQLDLPFPTIPDPATMINLQMNKYPTFFGCYDATEVPLVLYFPNAPWSAYSNYSYTVTNFTDNQLNLLFENQFNAATFGNGALDPEWSACMACAVIKKSVERVGMCLPPSCDACFERHCWNGTRVETPSMPSYNPKLILDPNGPDYAVWNATVWT